MTDRDPRQSIRFEPVALGRRRRRLDPVAIGVLAVAVGLGLAVVKPWAPETPDGTAVAPVVRPSASAASSDASGTGGITLSTDVAPLRWGDIASIVLPRDGWGVRTIVQRQSRTTAGVRSPFEERWFPVAAPGSPEARVVLPQPDLAIVALGVTFPTGRAPVDVRVWRRTSSGTLRWLAAQPLGRAVDQGGLVFAPPSGDPGPLAWGPGEYRIEALLASGAIERLEVDIPDRYEQVRPPSLEPPSATELVAASAAAPASLPVGAFATIDQVGVPLTSASGPALDEAAAWLAATSASGPASGHRVAVAYLPRATGLGVRLPDGAAVRAASMTRLAPDALLAGPVHAGILHGGIGAPWVVFVAGWGAAWDPGVYRIDVTWAVGAVVHRAAWHVELRPGPLGGPDSPP